MIGRRRRRNSRPDVYVACAVILLAHGVLFRVLISKGFAHVVPAPRTTRTSNRSPAAPVRPAVIRTSLRAIYPHSVIRGGAYSVAELRAALRVDPVAAAHYAVFDRSQMHITRASDSAAVYVSYRQGDRVYWTRNKMRLAAGESLLTDGIHLARSRCGNRISLTPQEPTLAGEPSTLDLDLPEPSPVTEADGSAAEPMDLSSLPMMVVHEMFPDPLVNWLPASLPADPPAGSAGGPMLTFAPGGERFSGPRQQAPLLLSGLTFPPSHDVWPIEFHTLPPQPAGPGFLGIQPLSGSYGPGSIPGPPPAGTVFSPPLSGLPSIPGDPGGLPFQRPPAEAVLLLPGLTFPPVLRAGGPLPQGRLPPDAPLPVAAEIPEPATAALLLLGAVMLAFRGLVRQLPKLN